MPSELWSSKLIAKANRQIQEPALMFLGYSPTWLTQICRACPFIFPFETRHLLFVFSAFDRERFLTRLQETANAHVNMHGGLAMGVTRNNGGNNSGNAAADAAVGLAPTLSQSRAAPLALNDFIMSAGMASGSSNNGGGNALLNQLHTRLDKRRRTLKRDDLLKQAMKLSNDLANTRVILEIEYDREPGIGLGPTLEFFTLISKELQRVDLDMWRHDRSMAGADASQYVLSPSGAGLFPAPICRSHKPAFSTKLKSRFHFLGRLLARALLDARLIDMHFSPVFYKYLLGLEHTLGPRDLHDVDPTIARSWWSLYDYVRRRDQLLASNLSSEQKRIELDKLRDEVAGIDLHFYEPVDADHSSEFKKGGYNLSVTLDNLEEYLELKAQWILVESVTKQFEALRDGFNSVFSIQHLQLFDPQEVFLILI